MTKVRDLGVYCVDEGEQGAAVVHLYQGGEYSLLDVAQYFRLGQLQEPGGAGWSELELTRRELRELKVMADAYSFDYEAAFIEMCLELYRFAAQHTQDRFRFRANF